MQDIQPLKHVGIERALTTLERAFANDPVSTWMFPDPVERALALRAINRIPLRFGVHYGHATGSTDGTAVAVWLPPGQSITFGRLTRCGVLGVPFAVGFRPFAQFMNINGLMAQLQRPYLRRPHWCLQIVGVDPDFQGRGLGSALVNEGITRADAANHGCYVATSDERNLAFYERHGFAIVGSTRLPDGGPSGWAMWREPRTAAVSSCR